MKINALIDTIKRSIATGSSTSVKIVEHTMMFNILMPDDNKPSRCHPSYRKIRTPDGKLVLKNIIINIWQWIKRLPYAPLFNLIVLSLVIILALISIFLMLTFLIMSFLLPKTNYSVNDRGTLVVNQPLEREQYLFLLNTSELWADSGIEVMKGDEVTISASGSFYSEIDDLIDAVTVNKKPMYNYYNRSVESNPGTPFTMMPTKPFGVLLYQIQMPGEKCATKHLDPKRSGAFEDMNPQKLSFTSEVSGVLHFAVNDIIITNELIDNLDKSRKDKGKGEKKGSNADLPTKLGITQAEVDSLRKYLSSNPDEVSRLWFYDNCGEMLINVQISRRILSNSNIPWYEKPFIALLRLVY